MDDQQNHHMGAKEFVLIAGVSYVLTKVIIAIWERPIPAAVICFALIIFGWIDGGTWFEALGSFQGFLMLFALVLGGGMFFSGRQIQGLGLFFVAFLVCSFLQPQQRWGEVTTFNAAHEDEMMVYDVFGGGQWKVVKLPLSHRDDRLIQVSDWQWNLAEPDDYNNDGLDAEKHPEKLVETAPGKWEFVKREAAYPQEVVDRYNRPITRWFAKTPSKVAVYDVSRPITNPYYTALHTKAASPTKPVKPGFFQRPFGIYCLIMTPILLIFWVVTRFFPKMPDVVISTRKGIT